MRREIPLILTSVAGLVFAISYFIPHWPFGQSESIFGDWILIVAAFAIWLGALNLLQVSLLKITRRSEGWGYAIVVIVSLLITLAVGFYSGYHGKNMNPPVSFRDAGTYFDWIYRFVYTPLSSTMFSMLAFFVASAAYRAFRARNLEASILLITGFFVMGGRVPLFDLGTGWLWNHYPVFSKLSEWIMAVINSSGQRAIMIGIALGIMSSSLRIILGIERSHVGGGGG